MGNTSSSIWLDDMEVDNSKGVVHEDWNMCPGTLRETPVTVFSAVHPSSSKKRPYMENALQASKIYRHPGLLRFIEGGVVGSEIFIITESASPLLLFGIDNMSLLQITAGLSSIIEALIFLHDKAGVSHNNVSATSIYVTSDGLWKLWGMEYICSFGDLSRGHIERINPYCNEKNIPPDNCGRLTPAYQHARDCYSFGNFINDHIGPFIDPGDALVNEFLEFIQAKALHKDWSQRPRLLTFSNHSLFQHNFLQLRRSLSHILLKNPEERDEFIRSLPDSLRSYPEMLVASTLSSLLLSPTFFLIPTSASHFLPYLLRPKSETESSSLFSVPIYKEYILPRVLHLFSVRDASIRSVLCSHFEFFAHLIPKENLTTIVLPELLLGIRDRNDELVSNTLCCLAFLVPLLGADVVVGRNRKQIFSNAKPKSTLNTTRKMKSSYVNKNATLNIAQNSTISHQNSFERDISHNDLGPINEIASVIPERSSPDGGEVVEDVYLKDGEVKTQCSPSFNLSQEEQWSDWEEMIDQPSPDIIGILKVKSPSESEMIFGDEEIQMTGSVEPCSGRELNSKHSESDDNSKRKLSNLPEKTRLSRMSDNEADLGQDFDIMSIKIKKKLDAESDVFADLVPNLKTHNYNLESMLMEASQKSKKAELAIPSLSSTLAQLDLGEEGDDWNEENWCHSDDNL